MSRRQRHSQSLDYMYLNVLSKLLNLPHDFSSKLPKNNYDSRCIILFCFKISWNKLGHV